MRKQSITAVVLAKNNEQEIKRCLSSLAFCDEIIVIDDFSLDNTVSTAKRFGAQVFKRHLNSDFSTQRNFALAKAKHDWVLFVDSDEVVSQSLRVEINEKTQNWSIAKNCVGFYMKRQDFLFGRWLKYGETSKVRLMRLARKDSGKWIRPVHEVWDVKGKIWEFKNPLLHYPHKTIREFLKEINTYSSINAGVFFKNKVKVSMLDIIAFPTGKFLYNFFVRLGFLDGVQGLILAVMMSFHSFLTRGKLFIMWQKNEEK